MGVFVGSKEEASRSGFDCGDNLPEKMGGDEIKGECRGIILGKGHFVIQD